MVQEIELLLFCLMREPEEAKITRLCDYTEEDWEYVMMAAAQQTILPILYHTLKPLYPNLNIPEGIWDKMRSNYFHSAARNMRFYRQLLQTISLFENEGIPVILLKGAHLAEKVYGNIALRPMSDMDLLVRQEDLARIHELLIEEGYSFSSNSEFTCTQHLAPYRKMEGVSLEIHFHIADPTFYDRINISSLWDRAEKQSYHGVEARALCPEDLILHLCMHKCIQDGLQNGLIACFDASYIMEHYDGKINWNVLWNRGQEWGIERSIYLMLALTEKVIGLSVPVQFDIYIKPDQDAINALETAETIIFERSLGLKRNISRLFGQQGWRTKLFYLVKRAFPPKETMLSVARQDRGSLKGFKIYWLYLRRLQNLLKEHGRTVWSGLLRDQQTTKALDVQNERNKLRDWLIQA